MILANFGDDNYQIRDLEKLNHLSFHSKYKIISPNLLRNFEVLVQEKRSSIYNIKIIQIQIFRSAYLITDFRKKIIPLFSYFCTF